MKPQDEVREDREKVVKVAITRLSAIGAVASDIGTYEPCAQIQAIARLAIAEIEGMVTEPPVQGEANMMCGICHKPTGFHWKGWTPDQGCWAASPQPAQKDGDCGDEGCDHKECWNAAKRRVRERRRKDMKDRLGESKAQKQLNTPVLGAEPKSDDNPSAPSEAKAKLTTEGRTGTANVPTGIIQEAQKQGEGEAVSERDWVASILRLSLDTAYSDSEALAAITRRCQERLTYLAALKSQPAPVGFEEWFEDNYPIFAEITSKLTMAIDEDAWQAAREAEMAREVAGAAWQAALKSQPAVEALVSDEVTDLLARYLEMSGWSVWGTDDLKLNALRDAFNKSYAEHRDTSFTKARLEGYKAVVREAYRQRGKGQEG